MWEIIVVGAVVVAVLAALALRRGKKRTGTSTGSGRAGSVEAADGRDRGGEPRRR